MVKGLGLSKDNGGLVAAEALQDLCDDCSEHMASPQQLQGMLQLYSGIDALEVPLQEKILQVFYFLQRHISVRICLGIY